MILESPDTTEPDKKRSKTEIKSQEKPTTKSKTASKPSKATPKMTTTNDDFSGFSDAESEDDVASKSLAEVTGDILAGFSSDSSSDEEDAQDSSSKPTAISKIPSLPDSADLQSQLAQAKSQTASDPDAVRGVVFLSRIPHGFYEPQMKSYFAQFGDVTRLRLSRNKLTGKAKHYGYIEFASSAVAEVVAKTMDKYLMFGHILQAKLLKPEEVHPNLWKGSGSRFKAMPRNKIEGKGLENGSSREKWEKKVAKEGKRREGRRKMLEKEFGYEFETPALKHVDSVPRKIEDKKEGETVAEIENEKDVVEQEDKKDVVEVEDKKDQGEVDASNKRKKTQEKKKTTKKPRLST